MLERFRTDPPEAPVERVDPRARPALRRVTTVGWLLDDTLRLPRTNRTFGVDAAVGVVPVLGDAFAAVVSWYIVLEAVRLRAPPRIVGRMLFNVGVDFLLGVLPVLGFFLDVMWPANEKNAKLLETYLLEERTVSPPDVRTSGSVEPPRSTAEADDDPELRADR